MVTKSVAMVTKAVDKVTKTVAMATKAVALEIQVGYAMKCFNLNRISTRVTSVTIVSCLEDVQPLHSMVVGRPKSRLVVRRCPLRMDGRTLLANYTIC
eukprot:sb/3478865/